MKTLFNKKQWYYNEKLKTCMAYGYWLDACNAIKKGANPNLKIKGLKINKNSNNEKQKIIAPVLFWALEYQQTDLIKVLLLYGANIDKRLHGKFNNNETCACWVKKDLHFLRLLQSGLLLHQRTSDKGDIAVHLIVKHLWINSFEWLLRSKAPLNVRNQKGELPLDILKGMTPHRRDNFKYIKMLHVLENQ